MNGLSGFFDLLFGLLQVLRELLILITPRIALPRG